MGNLLSSNRFGHFINMMSLFVDGDLFFEKVERNVSKRNQYCVKKAVFLCVGPFADRSLLKSTYIGSPFMCQGSK